MATNLMSGPFAKLAGVFDDLVTLSADQIAMTNVPDFLKIAALNAQAQTRNTPVSPPQSTVADDLLAGVGALETSPDQFGDRYYNRGGIVSFSDGGDTSYNKYIRRDPATGAAVMDPRLVFPRTPEEKAARKAYEEHRAGILKGEKRPEVYGQFGDLTPPKLVPPPLDGRERPIDGRKLPREELPTTTDGEISVTPRPLMPPFEDIVGPVGGASLDPEDYKVEYVPIQPSERKTPEQTAAELAQDLAAGGVDPEARMAGKRERLSKLEERFAEETKQAPWLALMQAGLKMAQTPGSFGQALAAGAQTGLTDYLRAKKDLTESEQALLDRQDALDDLEYATKMEDVNAIRAERARADEEERRIRETNFKGENEVRMRNAQIDFEVAKAQLAQQGDMQKLRALHEYRLADLTKDHAMMQVILGKEAINAASTGRLTDNQTLEFLADRAEELSTDPTFRDTYYKDKPSATEEEIYAKALEVSRRDLKRFLSIVGEQKEVGNKLRSLYGLGSLGTTGFFVTPASK